MAIVMLSQCPTNRWMSLTARLRMPNPVRPTSRITIIRISQFEKGDNALNILGILFCQLIIVLTINYLVHFQRVSEQGGTNSKTPD